MVEVADLFVGGLLCSVVMYSVDVNNNPANKDTREPVYYSMPLFDIDILREH